VTTISLAPYVRAPIVVKASIGPQPSNKDPLAEQRALDARYTVHRLWEAANRDGMIDATETRSAPSRREGS
jgi:hypothetical protein